MLTLLLCEDETAMRKIVKKILVHAGYRVIEAADGEEALKQFYQEKIDLVLLDWMMPKYSGLEIVKTMKKERQIKILMLTAKSLPQDEVNALLNGVDDYLAKPFHAEVLLTRIAKLLGIGHVNLTERIILLPNQHKLLVDKRQVFLSKKEYELFLYLYQNKRLTVTREQILMSVWGMEMDKDLRTVDSFIRLLREKVGKEFIKTVYGRGYQFDVPEK